MWILSKKPSEIIEHFMPFFFFFFLCMYKKIKISAETWNNARVSVLKIHENDDVNKTLVLLLCVSDISKRLGYANIYGMIDKEIKGKCNVKKMNEITKKTNQKIQTRQIKIDYCNSYNNANQLIKTRNN